jgi:hypothetical protein
MGGGEGGGVGGEVGDGVDTAMGAAVGEGVGSDLLMTGEVVGNEVLFDPSLTSVGTGSVTEGFAAGEGADLFSVHMLSTS